ncbi:MAG: type IV secretory system conjugative DNA transfer family protein [Planctomycetes bacterium]|nr:type IV secretory system conjugative DNA transfer family protein [Planctomycetota bacterium]
MFKLCRYTLIVSLVIALYIAILLVAAVPYLWLLAAAILVGVVCKKGHHRYTTHGSSRWADGDDLLRAGMLDADRGLILGTVERKTSTPEGVTALINAKLTARQACQAFILSCRRRQPRRLVRLPNAVHTAIFAPSGAGKNVSIVEPFLLSTRENCVVIDIKGENAKLTAGYRARTFGHKIVMVDPCKIVTAFPDVFNVLDAIDPDSPESFDQIRAVAEAIVIKEPNARDPHWSQKAEIFVAGVIAAVLHICPPDRRSLQEVASILADKALLGGAIQALRRSTAHDGLLARLGSEMSISSDKELDGILSTANRSLAFLSTPAVVESTKGTSSFNPSELYASRGITIYLILPAQYLKSHAGLMRLWVTTLMRSVVSRGVGNPRPVNVILDECAALGHLEAIDDMLTIGRGFGLKITAIFQSMAQLKKVFPEGQDGVLLSNTTQVFFAVNDHQTAEYVSNRLGDETILVRNWGANSGTSRQSSKDGSNTSYSQGSNEGFQPCGRRLLQPSEVAQLDPRIAITFTPGCRPIATWLSRYYEGDFRPAHGIGLLRIVVESVCLFVAVALLAVMVTAGVANHTFEGGTRHVKPTPGTLGSAPTGQSTGPADGHPVHRARPVAEQVLQRRR